MHLELLMNAFACVYVFKVATVAGYSYAYAGTAGRRALHSLLFYHIWLFALA